MSEKYIQKQANKLFPAQELWFRNEKFWAFLEEGNDLYVTAGEFTGGTIRFETIIYEAVIKDELIREQIQAGYECKAILF
jgi:hypothetical protein